MGLREAMFVPGQRGRVEIPDTCRADLPGLCVDLGFQRGAEIGVDRGQHLETYCAAGLTMVGVDPWAPSSDYTFGAARLEGRYQSARARLAPYGDRCTLLRLTSIEAAATVPDGGLDFVYIDGYHGFAGVAADLWAWSPKVRPGGLVMGHDYVFTSKPDGDANVCHVAPVVDAWMRALHLSPWFVLGRKEKIPGEKRDRCRSWFYVKQGRIHA